MTASDWVSERSPGRTLQRLLDPTIQPG
jgi:hypothetical protein